MASRSGPSRKARSARKNMPNSFAASRVNSIRPRSPSIGTSKAAKIIRHSRSFPASRPLDLFDRRAKRALASMFAVSYFPGLDVLPGWLRFVRLVIDSADLPLNVSREMIQQSPIFTAIKKGVANRILQELVKTAENDAETFKPDLGQFRACLEGRTLRRSGAARPDLQDRPLRDIARSESQPYARRLCRRATARIRPRSTTFSATI